MEAGEYEPNAALMNEGVGHIPSVTVEDDVVGALRQIVWLLTGIKRSLADVEVGLRNRR
jgi:hypothetical protein